MPLPLFLQEHNRGHQNAVYQSAIFHHKRLGQSHALWWPSKLSVPTTVILFIPGNPGLLNFYLPFLNALYEKDVTSSLAIFAHSHIGHTPGIEENNASSTFHGLSAQIEGSIEAFDAVESIFGEMAKIVVIGHSVGAWISLQVLKARPAAVSGVFLLFPTISYIRDTPNGQKISWLFSYYMRTFVSRLSYLTQVLPTSVISRLFPAWPMAQVLVLQTLLYSPPSILAALHMADDEMHAIGGPDVPLLTTHRDKMWFYYAAYDDWVGEQMQKVLAAFQPELENTRIVRDLDHGIPHAFCINHGAHLAIQCNRWLDHLRTLV